MPLYVTIGYMKPHDLKRTRVALGLTQEQLAEKLNTTRQSVARYELGTRRIPGIVEVALERLATAPNLPLVGVVAAGEPIEAIPQMETVDVPSSMLAGGENFALRVKGTSMQDEGILPGDIVIVHKQATARNGQTVVALLDNEATIKKFYRKGNRIELHPANEALKPLIVSPDQEFRIEGVLVGVIRHCR